MRVLIPFITLFLSITLCASCSSEEGASTDGGVAGSGGTDGGTGGTDGGTGGTDGGTGGTDGGTGGSVGNVCGAGTACDSQDGDSGEWCITNICGSQENLLYAFCNDNPGNPAADGEFACGCEAGECSRTPENDCFEPTSCTFEGGDAFCRDICATECGDEARDAFCVPTSPETGFCECACPDGTGTCL